jgi:chorismate synthase
VSSTFGRLFQVHTFGESHGAAVGCVIDGVPAGLSINLERVQHALDRRRPGQSSLTTARNEADQIEVLSGLFEGKTTGAPLAMMVRNKDARPADYDTLRDTYRPSHADYTYIAKYGLRDHRGGGRSSARETLARVAAGAIALQMLEAVMFIQILTWVDEVHGIAMPTDAPAFTLADIEATPTRCPHPETATKIQTAIEAAREAGDSLGGIVACSVTGLPPSLGAPVFDKLPALLAHAMLSINATKGFELGSGFGGTRLKGSEHNDAFDTNELGKPITLTNHSGGSQGGLSNGMPLNFRVAFKPTATIAQAQQTITTSGEATILEAKGRHDPCVLPRAVPIVEAMALLVLADLYLLSRGDRL